jgi:hypothetical protein
MKSENVHGEAEKPLEETSDQVDCNEIFSNDICLDGDGDEVENEAQILYYQPSKNSALSIWISDLKLVEIKQFKGNFWKKVGFSEGGRHFLYPEEALYCYERRQLLVSKNMDDYNAKIYWNKKDLFTMVIQEVSLSSYLVYAKLKVSLSVALPAFFLSFMFRRT